MNLMEVILVDEEECDACSECAAYIAALLEVDVSPKFEVMAKLNSGQGVTPGAKFVVKVASEDEAMHFCHCVHVPGEHSTAIELRVVNLGGNKLLRRIEGTMKPCEPVEETAPAF